LYVLLAAYADAGEASPSAATLCKRLGIDIKTLDALLRRLERDGHLRVAWRQGPSQRNVYSLCDGRRP